VDDDALQRLLDLQSEDSAIRRLEERRSSLPEATQLAEVSDQLAELEADSEIARKQLDEITREHHRLEGEIGLAEQKIQKEEGRLFSGAVSNPKELGALQAEVAMLKRKRGELEDRLLEVMLQRDDANSTVESLERDRSNAARQAEILTETVSGLLTEIDDDLRRRTARRAEMAPIIPADLLSLYEKIRPAKGGVGVAALMDGTCQGCHTRLPSKEAERLRAERGLQRCDNCGRLLVVK
jgi:uncharacterized protein